jgi:hypothetical protein
VEGRGGEGDSYGGGGGEVEEMLALCRLELADERARGGGGGCGGAGERGETGGGVGAGGGGDDGGVVLLGGGGLGGGGSFPPPPSLRFFVFPLDFIFISFFFRVVPRAQLQFGGCLLGIFYYF